MQESGGGERERNEANAKAGDEIPAEKKGDTSSRLKTSEDPEKRRVLEKLEKRKQDPS